MLRRHRLVHLAPIHVLLRLSFLHDELVVGRPPGVRASLARQRAVGGELTFLAADGVFVQRRRAEIAVNGTGGPDAMLFQPLSEWRHM